MEIELDPSDLKTFYNFEFPKIKEEFRFWLTTTYHNYITKQPPDPTLKSKTNETVSNKNDFLNNNDENTWFRWDCVFERIYISVIPSPYDVPRIIDHIERRGEKLGKVVATVDYHEYGWKRIGQPEDWHKKNIKHYMLPITDFTANISNRCIMEAVLEINETYQKNEAVLIHCKAGRSRSAMQAIIWAAVFHPAFESKTAEEIECYIQKKSTGEDKVEGRKQIELMPEQRKKANEVITEMRKRLKENVFQTSDVNEINKNANHNISEILSSQAFLNTLRSTLEFKKLAIHTCARNGALQNDTISLQLKDLYRSMLEKKDGAWYKNLKEFKIVKSNDKNPGKEKNFTLFNYIPEPVTKFFNKAKEIYNYYFNFTNDEETQNYIDELAKKIDNYLVETFGFSKEEITEFLNSFQPQENIVPPRMAPAMN